MAILLSLLVGSYGYYLLTLDPGTRSAAMATAGAEFSGTAEAARYNPAGLGLVPALDVSFEHNTVPAYSPINYWTAAAAAPILPRLSAGVSGSGLAFDIGGKPDDHDVSTALGVAYRPVDFLAVGLGLKYNCSRWYFYSWYPLVETTLVTGSSVAADFGACLDVPTSVGRFRAAASGLNLGTLHSYGYGEYTSRDTLPWTWRASAGYALSIEQVWPDAPGRLPPALEPFRDWLRDNWQDGVYYTFEKVERDLAAHSVGLEVKPLPVLAARVGWFYAPAEDTANTRQGWTWGFGLDFKFLRASVAWDEPLFYVHNYDRRLRYEIAVQVGEPLLPERGLFR